VNEIEIQQRLIELRREQRRTVDQRQKAIIKGEITHWQNTLRKLQGFDNRIGGVGSKQKGD
jgi:hypothetical protein